MFQTQRSFLLVLKEEWITPHYEWFQEDILPPIFHFWHRLDVPTWDVYRQALKSCGNDLIQSSQSTGTLLYLTFRPIAILSWIVFQFAMKIGKILFRHLLEHGWISLKKGAKQVKIASIWCYHFQRSLTRTEVLAEVGVIVVCILLYYLRKWLKRQTYVARATIWCRQKKQRVIQVYTRTLHKVAQVSLLLAMTLPHLAFIGAGIGLRIVFPSLVKWLAYDTYATALLSIWYPLVYTLGWIHQDRYPQPKPKTTVATDSKDVQAQSQAQKEPILSSPAGKSVKEISSRFDNTSSKSTSTPTSASSKQKSQPSYLRTTAAQQSRERSTKRRAASLSSKVFPATSPKRPETPSNTPTTPTRQNSQSTNTNTPAPVALSVPPPTPEPGTKYWIRYWVVFSIIQAFGNVCSIIPIFGRFVARHPIILSAAAELKLFFFIWMFGMEALLGNAAQDALLAQALPMRLLDRHLTPILLEFDAIISEAVPKAQWKNMVHSKVQRVLEVFVMVRFISEPWKDWALHIVDEGRVLLIPSITLLMPGFVTQFGVAYVQFIVPSAKSARVNSEKNRVLYLQYWVMHCVLSGFLTWFSSILWWIPFSSHLIFLAWCHLSFPQTIKEYYPVLEMELVAFGLLKGDSKLGIHDTRTLRLLTAVAARLPSAAEIEDDDAPANDDQDDDNAQDTKDAPNNQENIQEIATVAVQGDAVEIEVVVPTETNRVILEVEKQKSGAGVDNEKKTLQASFGDEGSAAAVAEEETATPQDNDSVTKAATPARENLPTESLLDLVKSQDSEDKSEHDDASEEEEEEKQDEVVENPANEPDDEEEQEQNDQDYVADITHSKPLCEDDDSLPDLAAKTLMTYDSDSSASRSNDENEADHNNGQRALRRSTRNRKPVKYDG